MTSIVYFIERQSDGMIKIGVTKNMRARFHALTKEYGELSIKGVIHGGLVREKLLHWIFDGQRVDGEFFKPDKELLDIIDKYAAVPDYYQKTAFTKTKTAKEKSIRVTINTTEESIKRFRRIAERFGMVSASGPLAGQGNQNQLVEAIANGRLLVVENPAYEAAPPS